VEDIEMRRFWISTLALLFGLAAPAVGATDAADDDRAGTGRIVGTVNDQHNGMRLPGVTVELTGTEHVAHTDLDGRFLLDLPAGSHEVSVNLEGYARKQIQVNVPERQTVTVDVTLGIAGYSELVMVTGDVVAAETSTAEAQLLRRKRASTITDNMGAQEMRANADSSAAAALQRVTGLSIVDDQYVFVRGLGERYSNTTLNGASIPSTEPDRKVVSLDMFPAGLLDSVTVVKSYSADRPAEFAGGLVEIVPARLPSRPHFDVSYGAGANTQTVGAQVLDHAAGDRDWLGLSNGNRKLPAAFPDRRLIRGGVYTPELGFTRAELEGFGEAFENAWTPETVDGKPDETLSVSFARRFGRLGVLAGVNQSYRHHYQEEVQNYYRVEDADRLTTFSEYDYRAASNRGVLAGLLGVSTQFTPQQRVAVQAFGSARGERETRTFEGFNSDGGRNLRNARLLWREESLRSAQVTGDHLFPSLSNSTIDWRLTVSRSSRAEPDLRETLYEEIGSTFQLADESQSGFRMFNDLNEDTVLEQRGEFKLFSYVVD